LKGVGVFGAKQLVVNILYSSSEDEERKQWKISLRKISGT
jgi:hypothetical protein